MATRINRKYSVPKLKVEAIFDCFKEIEEHKEILYIQGTIGMGKTTAVRLYYGKHPFRHYDGSKGYYEDMLPLEEIQEDTIVFDDISSLLDLRSRDYVCQAVRQHDHRLVLISRSEIPDWLYQDMMEQPILLADNSDLELPTETVKLLLKEREILLDEDDTQRLIEACYHNTFMLVKSAELLDREHPAGQESLDAVRNATFRYVGKGFFDRLDHDMQHTLICVCPFERFTVELARMLTGNPQVIQVLEEMRERGDFLERGEGDYEYAINPLHQGFLRWKMERSLSRTRKNNLYALAGRYYELNEEPLEALKCYDLVGATAQMVELLNRLARKHPGMENFRDVQKYYDRIPDNVLEKFPALMAAKATIESLTMHPLKSDAWIRKLEEYIGSTDPLSQQYMLAESILLFLNVTLPHVDKTTVISQIKEAMPAMEKNLMGLGDTELSVIDSTPSLLNGASELSDLILSLRGQISTEQFMSEIQEIMDLFLDYHATAYMELVYAEWKYERCEMESFELSSRLNEAYMKADAAGALENCFVAIALLARVHLDNGNYRLAEDSIRNFREKVLRVGDSKLLKVIDEHLIKMHMLTGDLTEATEWLNSAPNSNVFFTILDRTLYIDKLEILIPLGRKEESLALIYRLLDAFERYHRPYDWIRVQILKAILLYRTKEGDWKEELTVALERAQRYGYVHLVADYGAALTPLLAEFNSSGLDTEFYQTVWEIADNRAVNFPNFMKPMDVLEEPLTEREHKVIRLMCAGMTSEAICDMLHISYSGLKFHKQNVYRKLKVKSRQAAERKAKSLGLDLG